ncbi:MAG: hypothetical protein ACHQUB_02725 [Candidatus Saccharimonadia bacterium]
MNRQLNNNQTLNLNTVLTFRYVTTDNLAIYRNITHNSAYSALEILHIAGYLGKIYDKSYRLLNKSARYYLTQQGLDYVRGTATAQLDEAIYKSRKGDEKKTPDFIDQQVAIHSAYNELRASLGSNAKILTGLDTYGIEGIIKPLPGLLVQPKSGKHFFVELADGQHLFLIRKRIRKYIQNYEDGDWEWDHYPIVYIVRSSASDRTRLRKYVEEQMDDNYLDADDFTFHVLDKADRIKV